MALVAGSKDRWRLDAGGALVTVWGSGLFEALRAQYHPQRPEARGRNAPTTPWVEAAHELNQVLAGDALMGSGLRNTIHYTACGDIGSAYYDDDVRTDLLAATGVQAAAAPE